MKGILRFDTPKEEFSVEYLDDSFFERTVSLPVPQDVIERLNRKGTYLQVGQEVDFEIRNVDHFPYRYAIPYVANEGEQPTTQSPTKQFKKKLKMQMWLNGFPEDYHEVICDGYESSSNGYYFFYDMNNGNRKIIAMFPIERTAIHTIGEVEVEV